MSMDPSSKEAGARNAVGEASTGPACPARSRAEVLASLPRRSHQSHQTPARETNSRLSVSRAAPHSPNPAAATHLDGAIKINGLGALCTSLPTSASREDDASRTREGGAELADRGVLERQELRRRARRGDVLELVARAHKRGDGVRGRGEVSKVECDLQAGVSWGRRARAPSLHAYLAVATDYDDTRETHDDRVA